MNSAAGIVLFGDVIASRREAMRSTEWLRGLTSDLNAALRDGLLAPFDFTQGDELQGLLRPGADPFEAILIASLDQGSRQMRWSVAAGQIDPGSGPATQRTGPAFLAAREAITRAKAQRDGLLVVTGQPATDTLLDDVAPLFTMLLDELTDRQRVIARLMLLDGRRQSEIADELGIARPTVSVAVERARVREIRRLRHALLALLSGPFAQHDGQPSPESAKAPNR